MEYHPPKAPLIDAEAFERCKDVMAGCDRFHDMMLGRLLELAAEDATVILLSEHGFYCDHLRPEGSSRIGGGRPVAGHRRYGILMIHGPGIRRNERIYGASLLDITPTILRLFGLPLARDLDGRPLDPIFEQPPDPPPMIDSCELADAGAQPAVEPGSDSELDRQMLRRLADLGYSATHSTPERLDVDHVRGLGQICASTGRPRQAIGQFECLLRLRSGDNAARIAIAACELGLGRLDAAEKRVREVLTDEGDTPLAHDSMGIICARRGDTRTALHQLREAERTNPD